jgi:hypothetical protein
MMEGRLEHAASGSQIAHTAPGPRLRPVRNRMAIQVPQSDAVPACRHAGSLHSAFQRLDSALRFLRCAFTPYGLC